MAKTKQIKNFTLNFGPQHPAAHAVLRLVLKMNGEVGEQRAEAHIGLLECGMKPLTPSPLPCLKREARLRVKNTTDSAA
jgi:NADH:ubiquinone oxidoreductase subunit D